MSMIMTGATVPIVKCVEDANGDVILTDANGKEFDPVPKHQTRQFYRSLKDGTEVVYISDQLCNNDFSCKVTELQDGSGVISNTGTPATDRAAVQLYLGAFIGKL